MRISRLRCPECQVSLDGDFEVSPFARLRLEDQLFVLAFLRGHGSIKRMEGLFGISYPTVKNRLAAVVRELDRDFEAPAPKARVLERLRRGEISVDEALADLDR
ncbi:MAG: DUF2089 domain-containing protein [Candidatus Krumholzibacteriota bacterium]|nr:DUF2089 domain-containing protein [Candidatus Krumholzibacteriota bacterium]